MTLRKMWFLLWSTTLIGAGITVVVGSIMQMFDHEFGFMDMKSTGFNILNMALAGLLFGVFSQLGFFAYLTINYLALGMLRKKYLWNTLQAYCTLFAVGGLGYKLHGTSEMHQNNWFFWVLPLALLIASIFVSYLKSKRTNNSAFMPTMFLLFVGTTLEAWPSMGEESNPLTIVFMIAPLFVCNSYLIMQLHRIVNSDKADTAASAGTAL
ncbi:KinB-signaling pathway activation protein [Paenibacillus aurantiacus]|uniref:KinB-signaling pathway activation protein n=1 Tax=Paenibacillus aurantiacus TaxID=1936118 RepID=A0ABV5KW83_9BACL